MYQRITKYTRARIIIPLALVVTTKFFIVFSKSAVETETIIAPVIELSLSCRIGITYAWQDLPLILILLHQSSEPRVKVNSLIWLSALVSIERCPLSSIIEVITASSLKKNVVSTLICFFKSSTISVSVEILKFIPRQILPSAFLP